MGKTKLQAFADRGYLNSLEINACEDAGISAFVPKPMTSNAKATSRKTMNTPAPPVSEPSSGSAGWRTTWNCVSTGPVPVQTVPLRDQCTTSSVRRIRRWEHEAVIDRMQQCLDRKPNAMTLRRSTIEHVFGTLKHWMGSTHFMMKTMARVGTEMSLHVLAYNLKRAMSVLGIAKMMKGMRLAGRKSLQTLVHASIRRLETFIVGLGRISAPKKSADLSTSSFT